MKEIMKLFNVTNHKFYFLLIALIAIMLLTSGGKGVSENKLKIGTYDSRAVTYAYISSDIYKELQQKTGQERNEIMKTNDTAKWKETMSEVCTEQYLLHQRVFATGSAASVLRKVEKQLPAIAESAGVDFIVSKWELTWHGSNVEIVDLTDSIAQLFISLEKLDTTYEEIKKMEVVDVDEVGIGEVIEMWKQFEEKYLGR
ncbi:MAG: hypothetical protein CVT94_04315 [Bacteroidetes bacterium HGW-Bacteroidetes-11]|jgi:shikimate kinase|nr:MAG: hypothetical protein CVT94_04315 [Bacteroidetes bacterium HGW-Bacteroidetes-11]